MTMMGVGVKAGVGGGGSGVFVAGGGGGSVLVGDWVGTGEGDGLGVAEGVFVGSERGVGVSEGAIAAAVGVEIGVPGVEVSGLRTAKRIAATTVSATTIKVPTAMSRRWTGEAELPFDEGSGKDTVFTLVLNYFIPMLKTSPIDRNSGQGEECLLPARGR